MDWDVFICQVDVYCAALYRAESVHRMQAEQRRTGGEAGRAGSGVVGSRRLCSSLLTTQTDWGGKGGKGEEEKKLNSATHD